MSQILDEETAEQTLADGETIELTIGSGIDGRAIVLIDNGTTGGMPATYDLKTRRYSETLSDWPICGGTACGWVALLEDWTLGPRQGRATAKRRWRMA
jgi:hypothetical protein